jgi:hypothetical protein
MSKDAPDGCGCLGCGLGCIMVPTAGAILVMLVMLGLKILVHVWEVLP